MRDYLRDITFTQDIIVNYLRNADSSDVGWDHYHDYYEIYYYLGNHMTYFIADKTYDVHEDEIVLIDRFLLHRTFYRPNQRRDRILILFSPELLNTIGTEEEKQAIEQMFSNRKMTVLNEAQQQRVRTLIFAIATTNSDLSSPTRELQIRYQLYNLLLLMSGFCEDTVIFNLETNESSVQEQLVENVITYINAHFRDKITLDDIAENLFISKYHISRVFNELSGVSVTSFINTKRLSEAERLLRDTQLSIRHITHEVGFSSESYLIKLFKQKYACTPLEFREKLYGVQA